MGLDLFDENFNWSAFKNRSRTASLPRASSLPSLDLFGGMDVFDDNLDWSAFEKCFRSSISSSSSSSSTGRQFELNTRNQQEQEVRLKTHNPLSCSYQPAFKKKHKKMMINRNLQLAIINSEGNQETRLVEQENNPQNNGVFTINKQLFQTDVGTASRLLIPRNMARAHIDSVLTQEEKEQVESGKGIRVLIKDLNTNTHHHLTFKLSVKMKGYILKNNWVKSFVERRKLKKGDEIGMFWDHNESCFAFSVLQWAPRP